ncbi:MAG: HD domain-containing protein [Desulfobulbaceae bacterium]|uniref:HD domain-containing protein n=1 Tax=Candidatus Desulfobia pelagia TaxID=2841692 RepID=A0A8J6TDP1_9BACT|nr:HD domain-containing protein [Candidatus Desulfobia pelagia]
MEKGDCVENIQDNQKVEGLFLVSEVSRAETRAGKPYLTLKVMDKTGSLTGRVWDNADHWEKECTPGKVVLLQGQSQSYKGAIQLKINSVQQVGDDDVDLTAFAPSTSHNTTQMAAELLELVKGVADPHIRKLLLHFLEDNAFMEDFCQAPAAKNMHHAYLGGLLEHTLNVARLADMVAGLYSSVDRSLLIAGAILHDIGKIKEFSYPAPPFDYTDRGRLVGHIVLGVEMLHEHIAKIKGFPADIAMRLEHLILSHHGRYEFGSPALPMFHEAFILNFLDDLDSKINYVERLSSQLDKPGYQWSEYQRFMERFLYLSGTKMSEDVEESFSAGQEKKETAGPDSKQPPLLWGR